MPSFRRAPRASVFARHLTVLAAAAALVCGIAVPAEAVAAPASAAPAAATAGLVQNGTSQIVTTGSWSTSAASNDSGGSVSFATRAATASLTFTGSRIAWISRTSPSSGINTVYLDGVKVATVDRYSAETRYQQSVWSADVPTGTHTVEVRQTGTKNAKSTSPNLMVDAFLVDEVPTPKTAVARVGVFEADAKEIALVGTWSHLPSSSDSGGSSAYLNTPGYASMTFVGDTVEWVSRVSPNAGIATVSIDGIKAADVDRYAPTTEYRKTVFRRTGLSAGPHTIRISWTGRMNPASTTANLLIDSIVVPDTTPPAAPSDARASTSGSDVVLAWAPVVDAGLAGYRVHARIGDGETRLIGATSAGSAFFRSLGTPADSNVAYSVTAVDSWGNQSAPSVPVSMSTGATPSGSYRAAACPAATVTVTTRKDAEAAARAAKPGDVIRLAPGVWPKQLDITATGAPGRPVWICGSRDVVIDGGGYAVTSPINVSFSSHLVVTGMTATHALKGVTVRASDNVTISDMLVEDIGYEGIHLRSNTTSSTVVGNTIRRTGRLDPFYGEGVYIGSSKNNWCALTACEPDRSDRNAVLYNTISETGSDLIEAKEGTTGGLIAGNRLDGTGGMARTESWIMVSGNDWTVTSNSGTSSSLHGFRINADTPGWGRGTVLAQNAGKVDATGYGFKLWEREGPGSSGTLIACDNRITGAASGFANVDCVN